MFRQRNGRALAEPRQIVGGAPEMAANHRARLFMGLRPRPKAARDQRAACAPEARKSQWRRGYWADHLRANRGDSTSDRGGSAPGRREPKIASRM